jgi:MFS family permease
VAQGALPRTGWRQTFVSLVEHPVFATYYVGNIGFFFGMNMMIILRGWLVFQLTGHASALGLIMATVALPMLVLAPVGGVVADRVDKRTLLIWTQSTLTAINLANTVLVWVGVIEFWHLLVMSVLSGAAFSFNMPGRQALVPTLVPRERLMNAMSLTTAAMNASRVVAPALGGALIEPLGMGGAFAVCTAFYAVAAVTTAMLPPAPPVRRETEFTFFEDFKGGFAYIRTDRLVLGLLLFATVPAVFAMPYQTLMPVFADEVWDVGEVGLGLLQAAAGLGGLVGALVVANLDAYPRKGRLLIWSTVAFGAFVGAFALSPSFYPALLFIAATGLVSMVGMTVTNTSIQLVIPDHVRGRVMSVMMMTFGLMPLGSVPASFLADAIGSPLTTALGAGLLVASALLIFQAIPGFRSLDGVIEGRRAESTRRYLERLRAAGNIAPETEATGLRAAPAE